MLSPSEHSLDKPVCHSRFTLGEIAGLLLLGLVACAFNATKAVHIDDTAYLEIARAIRNDPLHPMRAELSWAERGEPIHAVNQPHLFFWLLAASMSVFGENEVAFHLVESAFTVLALLFFHLLRAPVRGIKSPLPVGVVRSRSRRTAGPEYHVRLADAGLLARIPLGAADAAAWIGYRLPAACVRLCGGGVPGEVHESRSFARPGTRSRLAPRLRRLWVLSVPVAVLALWSWWNYVDYGGIHLLERQHNAGGAEARGPRAWSIASALGP